MILSTFIYDNVRLLKKPFGKDMLARTMRSVAALVLPVAMILLLNGAGVAILLFGYGAATADQAGVMGLIVSVFMIGLLPFTLFYILLRGYYALEDTRTPFLMTVLYSAVMLALMYPLFNLVPVGGFQVGSIALAIGADVLLGRVQRRLTPQPFAPYDQKLHWGGPVGNGLPKVYVDCTAPVYAGLNPVKDLGKHWVVQVEDEDTDGLAAPDGQTPCRSVWSVAQISGSLLDSLATCGADLWRARQRQGHEGLRHPRPKRDIANGWPGR